MKTPLQLLINRITVLPILLVFATGILCAQTSYYHIVHTRLQPVTLNKAVTNHSNFYFAGSGNGLFMVMNTDSNGLYKWVKTFGAGSASDMLVDNSNNLVTVGTIAGRFAVISLKPNGAVQWQYNFNDSLGTSGANSVVQLTDSSYVIQGYDSNRVVILRLSAAGAPLFIYSPQLSVSAGKLAAAPDGGFVSLNVNSPVITDSLGFTISKFDTAANLLWARQYAYHDSMHITAFAATTGGGFIFTGTANDTAQGAGITGIMLAQIDSAGNVVWSKYYTDSIAGANAVMNSVVQSTDGGFLACGTLSTGANGYSILGFKTDTAGNFSWAKTYVNARNTQGAGAAVYKNGYRFFGTEGSPGNAGDNYIIINTDSTAQSGCATNGINFSATAMVLDTTGLIYADTALTYTTVTPFTATSSTATLTTDCPQAPYDRYYPLLDTANIWHYVVNVMPMEPPPGHHSKSLNTCGYPLSAWQGSAEYTSGDTTISGTVYKQMLGGQYQTPCLIGYIREDTAQRKVYFMDVNGSPEMVIYDFSLLIGDSIDIPFYQTNYSGWYRLDSVKTIQIFAGQRRQFYLHCMACTSSSAPLLVWIESTGSLFESVYPYADISNASWGGLFRGCVADFNAGYSQYNATRFVSCFAHSGLVYFDNCAYSEAIGNSCFHVIDSCNYGNICGAINRISDLSSFNIYPNPSAGQVTLNLEVNQSAAFDILVLDMQGREVLPVTHLGQLNDGTQTRQLDVSKLASGFYFVACKSTGGEVYKKLALQK